MIKRSYPFNQRARLLLLLLVELLNGATAAKHNNCYVTYSDGKMERHGDCQHPDLKNVLDDIKARAAAEQRSTTPPPNKQIKPVSEGTKKSTPADPKPLSTTTVATQPVPHNGPVYENCTSNRSEAYFWISEPHMTDIRDVTYPNRVEVCANCSSFPAIIPNEVTFNEIANTIRGMYTNIATRSLWLGMTVDQNTLKVDPPYAYVKWFDGHPQSGRPNVMLMVASSNSNTKMMSYAGSQLAHGVICWKPQSSAN